MQKKTTEMTVCLNEIWHGHGVTRWSEARDNVSIMSVTHIQLGSPGLTCLSYGHMPLSLLMSDSIKLSFTITGAISQSGGSLASVTFLYLIKEKNNMSCGMYLLTHTCPEPGSSFKKRIKQTVNEFGTSWPVWCWNVVAKPQDIGEIWFLKILVSR